MSLYKIKLVVGEYLMNDEMIKHLPYIQSKIEWFKKNNEPFDIIYIGEIHNKEMDEIIKALTFICRESTLDNFDITRIDEITIELIKAIEFLGFSELSDKIFSMLYHLIKNYTTCTIRSVHDNSIYNQISFDLDNIKRDPNNVYDTLVYTLSIYQYNNLSDQITIKCFLNEILPISSGTYKNRLTVVKHKLTIHSNSSTLFNVPVRLGIKENKYIFSEKEDQLNDYVIKRHGRC